MGSCMADTEIPVFLINLDRSPERLRLAGAALERAGLPFTRLSAVDGTGLDPDQAPDCDQGACRSFLGRTMSAGEYGCYLSHLEAARQVLATGAPHALVFEDDMDVVPQALPVLRALLARPELAAGEWDLVHLCADRLKCYSRLGPCAEGHDLVAAHYFPMTTGALLWSRDGARRFLEQHARVRMPVDFLLRQEMVRSGRGLALWPPLAGARGSESEIETGRRQRSARGRSWGYGVLKQRRLASNRLRAWLSRLRFQLARRRV